MNHLIDKAELNLTLESGKEIKISLSPAQKAVLLKLLGFELINESAFTFFCDEQLTAFFNDTRNPLHYNPFTGMYSNSNGKGDVND